MSTPASLHIKRSINGAMISLEQRCDGYPAFVLKRLMEWIAKGGALPYPSFDHNVKVLNEVHLAAYSADVRNPSLKLVPYYPHEAHVRGGNWSYVIDLDLQSIQVYENADDVDVFSFPKKGQDPLDQVRHMKPDCQDSGRASIAAAVEALSVLGFTVNPWGTEEAA